MPSPLTPDVLVYDFTAAGDPQLSPDGSRVLYSLGQTERGKLRGTSQLWLCDRDGGNARQLTHNGERNGGGRWSPDGRSIAFASDRSGGTGKEKGAALCILSLADGGEARELTRHRQGIGDLAWSPDGGGSHLFMRSGPPAHHEDVLTRTIAWFKDHLGGAE